MSDSILPAANDADPDGASLVGRRIDGRYTLLRPIGHGANGRVFEARNTVGRRFALKVMMSREGRPPEHVARRCLREARAAAKLDHPNVAQVLDSGIDGDLGAPWILMELLQGHDFRRVLASTGPMAPYVAARIVADAARGLAHAHAAGVVHRDVKPANLFLATRGDDVGIKVVDFGIAKDFADDEGDGGASLTRTGAIVGTPHYMSPEQAQGEAELDARADVWSLGVTLYEALAGRLPWGAIDHPGKLIVHICARDAEPVDHVAPWVPPAMARVVARAMVRDRGARLATANELADALIAIEGVPSRLALSDIRGTSGEPYELRGDDPDATASVEPDREEPAHADAIDPTSRTVDRNVPRAPASTRAPRRRAWIGAAAVAAIGATAIAATRTTPPATVTSTLNGAPDRASSISTMSASTSAQAPTTTPAIEALVAPRAPQNAPPSSRPPIVATSGRRLPSPARTEARSPIVAPSAAVVASASSVVVGAPSSSARFAEQPIERQFDDR